MTGKINVDGRVYVLQEAELQQAEQMIRRLAVSQEQAPVVETQAPKEAKPKRGARR